MDKQTAYLQIRNHLDNLHYSYPFTLDSMELVFQLLKDLESSRSSLKDQKEQFNKSGRDISVQRYSVTWLQDQHKKITLENNDFNLQLIKLKEQLSYQDDSWKTQFRSMEGEINDLKFVCQQDKKRRKEGKGQGTEGEALQKLKELQLTCEQTNNKIKFLELQVSQRDFEIIRLQDKLQIVDYNFEKLGLNYKLEQAEERIERLNSQLDMINHENTLTTSTLNKLKERPIEEVRITNQRLKNKIKELEAGYPKAEIQRHQQENEEIKRVVIQKDQKISHLDKALASSATYIESLTKQQSKELKALLKENKEQIQEKNKQIEQYQSDLKKQNQFFLSKIEEISCENDTLRLQLEELQQEWDELKRQNNQLYEFNQQISQQLSEKQFTATIPQFTATFPMDQMNSELQIMKDNNDHYLQKIEELNENIHQQQQKIDKYLAQIDKYQAQIEKQQAQIEKQQAQIEKQQASNPDPSPNLKKTNKNIEIELIKQQKQITSLTAQHKQKTEWFEKQAKDAIFKVSALTKQNKELADHISELEDYVNYLNNLKIQQIKHGGRGGHDQYIMQLQTRLQQKEKDINTQNELIDQLKEQNFLMRKKYFRSKQEVQKEEPESLKKGVWQGDTPLKEVAQWQGDIPEEEQGDNQQEDQFEDSQQNLNLKQEIEDIFLEESSVEKIKFYAKRKPKQ